MSQKPNFLDIRIDAIADVDYLVTFAKLSDEFFAGIETERAAELGTDMADPNQDDSFFRPLRNLAQGSVILMLGAIFEQNLKALAKLIEKETTHQQPKSSERIWCFANYCEAAGLRGLPLDDDAKAVTCLRNCVVHMLTISVRWRKLGKIKRGFSKLGARNMALRSSISLWLKSIWRLPN